MNEEEKTIVDLIKKKGIKYIKFLRDCASMAAEFNKGEVVEIVEIFSHEPLHGDDPSEVRLKIKSIDGTRDGNLKITRFKDYYDFPTKDEIRLEIL